MCRIPLREGHTSVPKCPCNHICNHSASGAGAEEHFCEMWPCRALKRSKTHMKLFVVCTGVLRRNVYLWRYHGGGLRCSRLGWKHKFRLCVDVSVHNFCPGRCHGGCFRRIARPGHLNPRSMHLHATPFTLFIEHSDRFTGRVCHRGAREHAMSKFAYFCSVHGEHAISMDTPHAHGCCALSHFIMC